MKPFGGRVAQRLSAVYAIGVSRKLFARLGQPAAMDRSAAYIRDFAMARQFLSSRGFVSFFFDLPFVPFYLALLLFVHPSICLLTVAGLGAMAAAGYFNFKWTEASREHSRAMDNEAAGFAQSVYSRSTEVRAFGMVPHLLTAWGAEKWPKCSSPARRPRRFPPRFTPQAAPSARRSR
ncbi:hypothetical protein QW131_33320 [Roseibium salinum]|nr:hypothetical protein [Roseibium salinum]